MNQTENRVQRIRDCLQQALAPQHLDILDDSEAHAGHDREARGAGHFYITVTSDRFAGMLPVARHRLVYSAVAEMMVNDIHALSIKALTPQEAANLKP